MSSPEIVVISFAKSLELYQLSSFPNKRVGSNPDFISSDNKIKSRLAKDIGITQAHDLYSDLVRLTEAALIELKLNFESVHASKIKSCWALNTENDLSEAFSRFYKFEQGMGPLGDRLYFVLNSAIKKFQEAQKIIIVGSDWPSINIPDLMKAAMTEPPCLGPANDGGFYLLSLSNEQIPKISREMWNSIKYSSSDTAAELRRVIDLDFSILPDYSDLDTVADLQFCISDLEKILGSIEKNERAAVVTGFRRAQIKILERLKLVNSKLKNN